MYNKMDFSIKQLHAVEELLEEIHTILRHLPACEPCASNRKDLNKLKANVQVLRNELKKKGIKNKSLPLDFILSDREKQQLQEKILAEEKEKGKVITKEESPSKKQKVDEMNVVTSTKNELDSSGSD